MAAASAASRTVMRRQESLAKVLPSAGLADSEEEEEDAGGATKTVSGALSGYVQTSSRKLDSWRRTTMQALDLIKSSPLHDELVYHSHITKTGRLKLLHRPKEEVVKVWEESARRDLADPVLVQGSAREGTNPIGKGKRSDGDIGRDAAKEGKCRVEFAAYEIYAWQTQDKVSVPVRRIGDTSRSLELPWKVTASRCPDIFFEGEEAMSGKVRFEEGQANTTFLAPAVEIKGWTPDDFYTVRLIDEDDTLDLGKNSEIDVWMVNEDDFSETIHGFLSYCCWQLPHEAAKGFLLCLYPAIGYYFGAQLLRSMVDCVSRNECGYLGMDMGASRNPIVAMLAIDAALFILSHLQEYYYRHCRLGGKATKLMRYNLFTVMMNLTNEARDAYDAGDIPKIIDAEVAQAMRELWVESFSLTRNVGELVVKLILTYQVAIYSSEPVVVVSLVCSTIAMFVLGLLTVCLSSKKELELQLEALQAEENWHSFVRMCESTIPIINGFRTYVEMADSINKSHGKVNKGKGAALDTSVTTMWILKYIFLVCRVVPLALIGKAVLDGEMNPGVFVLINKVLADISKNAIEISKTAQTMSMGRASVKRMAKVLNRTTRRKTLCGLQQEQPAPGGGGAPKPPPAGWASRQQPAKAKTTPLESTAQLERRAAEPRVNPTWFCSQMIKFRDVTYSYPAADKKESCAVLAVHPVSFELKPNQLVCIPRAKSMPSQTAQVATSVKGPRYSRYMTGYVGIDTLFKLMSRELFPSVPEESKREPGHIEVPEQWNVVYVPAVPVLFDGTLMFNLTFWHQSATAKESGAADDELPREAIWAAARRMGMSEGLIENEDFDVGTSGERLKMSDRLIVCILRALLARVDLLVMAGVCDLLGEQQGQRVLEVLSDYINQGALPGTYENVVQMHQKTVIYSTRFKVLQEFADTVLTFSYGGEPQEPSATRSPSVHSLP